ncbi:MAG: GNAT family N-acetyltransferase [Bacteroidota bacterium]
MSDEFYLDMGFEVTFRPFEQADEDMLFGLWKYAYVHEPSRLSLFREKVWGDPEYDPELTLLAETGDGPENQFPIAFAMAVVRETADYRRGHIKLLAVEETMRRNKLGDHMLYLLEQRLIERGVEEIRVAEAAPNYLTPGLDVRYTPGMLMLEAAGYERIGETYNLGVTLGPYLPTDRKEARLAKRHGIASRRARAYDKALMAGFLAEHWPAWKAEVEVAFQRKPIALHVAVRGTEMLGFAAYDTNNIGTGWFGPMGTAPGAQGIGIGAVLLKRCLRDLQAQGLKRAVIPWVGPVRFYANRVGATIDRVFYRYAKTIAQ